MLAKKFDIKEPKEWSKVTTSKVIENGGTHVLLKHKGSLFQALKSIYPGMSSIFFLIYEEIQWEIRWFNLPSKYWQKKENVREFFEVLAKKLNIRSPKDWGHISSHQIIYSGGFAIVKYHRTVFHALQYAYPGSIFFVTYSQ